MQTYQRTIEELYECVNFGKLYTITKVCGEKYLCCRCRRVKGKLHAYPNERVTVVRNKPSLRAPRVGDFAFVSSDNVWSIFMVDLRNDENNQESV